MSIKNLIYQQLPDVMRPSVEYIYYKYKYGGANYSVTPNQNTDKKGYTPPDKYREEIKNSEKFKENIKKYYSIFNIEDGNETCGGLELDSTYEMYSIIRDKKPSTVVETGVANGVSSLAILLALEKNKKGNLKSIDYPVYLDKTTNELQSEATDRIGWQIPADKNPGWIIPANLQKRWKLIEGKSVDKLPTIVINNDIDVFIHDSLHTTTNMIFEYFIAYHNMEDGKVILSDDISGSEAFGIFCSEMDISEYNRLTEDLSNDLGYIEI